MSDLGVLIFLAAIIVFVLDKPNPATVLELDLARTYEALEEIAFEAEEPTKSKLLSVLDNIKTRLNGKHT